MEEQCVKETVSADHDALCEELSAKFKLNPALTRLLIQRGIDTKEKVRRFLRPALENLSDPMLLLGMKEAVDRIRKAVESHETVVVCGDYDADGISSTAMLYRYLSERGVEVNCYIPEREQGYGLNQEAVEFIMEEFAPDLIITADCGISNREEIELILDLGGEVIVTDHHQIPQEIPECIVVNPWLPGQEGLFRDLCGGGVVWKLIQALEPEAAGEYLDLAMLATVADSVPLLGENRDLVALGLAELNSNLRACFAAYRGCAEKKAPMTASDVAFYLAPLINAAGRYGKAARAFEFLIEDDEIACTDICRELMELNLRRKADCQESTERLIGQIGKRKAFSERFICVTDEKLNHGIAGIVAAKLVEYYGRPVFVFTKEDDVLKGSARSVEGVNLFGILSGMSELFLSFGGHSGAGGLSLEEKNLKEFQTRLKQAMETYAPALFHRTFRSDLPFCEEYAQLSFLRELERLEPFGFGFERPVFQLTASRVKFCSLKKNPKYIRLQGKSVSPICFQGDAYADLLDSEFKKQLYFDLSVSRFRDVDTVGAQLKGVSMDFASECLEPEAGNARYLEQLYYPEGKSQSHIVLPQKAFVTALNQALSGWYGCAVICNTAAGFDYFSSQILPELQNAEHLGRFDYVRPRDGSSANTVLIAAGANLDFAAFSEVFFIEQPLNPGYASSIVDRYDTNVTCLEGGKDTRGFLKELSLERETFATYYRMVKRVDRRDLCCMDYYRWYREFKDLNFDINLVQFITCMFVFNDLGILKLDKKTGNLVEDNTKSGNIADSKFFRKVEAVKKSLH